MVALDRSLAARLCPLLLAAGFHAFVILGLDPRIHAVPDAEGCGGARPCTNAALQCHGMDPRVFATSLRSCFALG
ncbi:hypothetical protein ORS3428_27515 [Mesorhizobium sp. ORS 3428]|nr:hypothetical protein ORS3428_27515 [Mesorhizobium sp. ORS 3428]